MLRATFLLPSTMLWKFFDFREAAPPPRFAPLLRARLAAFVAQHVAPLTADGSKFALVPGANGSVSAQQEQHLLAPASTVASVAAASALAVVNEEDVADPPPPLPPAAGTSKNAKAAPKPAAKRRGRKE